VADTFVTWPHAPGKLAEFQDHLNGVHENIKFTMKTERDGHLPFLDTDIYRRPDGSLGHTVYRKHTHTNLYLHLYFGILGWIYINTFNIYDIYDIQFDTSARKVYT
jgi:hypothetical protein